MGITLPWRSDLNGLEQCRTLVRHECFLTHSVHGQSKSARLHQLHPTPPAQVPFWTTRNDEVKDGSVVGSEQLPQKVSASESQRAPQLLYLPFRRWWFKLCLGYVGSHAEHCAGHRSDGLTKTSDGPTLILNFKVFCGANKQPIRFFD